MLLSPLPFPPLAGLDSGTSTSLKLQGTAFAFFTCPTLILLYAFIWAPSIYFNLLLTPWLGCLICLFYCFISVDVIFEMITFLTLVACQIHCIFFFACNKIRFSHTVLRVLTSAWSHVPPTAHPSPSPFVQLFILTHTLTQPPTGSNWLVFHPYSFAFSRVSYKWKLTICSLLLLASFT